MLRNKSILQKDMTYCYVCGTTQNLITHEIYFGSANRAKSIKYGCYVRLCVKHHTMSNRGVHKDIALDTYLKQECQEVFERIYSHDKFVETFNKSYL